MALLGVALTGYLSAVAAAVLFARLLRDSERPVRAALTGAVFAVANVTSGRTTFAVGAVAALGALVLLPRRPRWAVVCGVVTGLCSPVAAAFLGFAAAILVLHRRDGGWSLGFAATVPVVLLAILFPGGGIQPFAGESAIPAVLAGLLVAALTSSPMIRTGGVLYALAVVFFAVHDDPFGSNVLRLGLLVSVSLLLATTRRHSVLVLAASIGLLVWQLDPTKDDIRAGQGPPMEALTAELRELDAQRVEVLAPRDHRESYEVAEQVPLVRGWSRQLDHKLNPLFYEGTLEAEEFLTWLRDNAVDHVAKPRDAVLDFGSKREGALLEGPVPGLAQVWSDDDWVVYAVDEPQPIIDAPATVVGSDRDAIVLASEQAAVVKVKLRWSRWLSLSGPGCIEPDGTGTRVRFSGPGALTLSSSLRPQGHCPKGEGPVP